MDREQIREMVDEVVESFNSDHPRDDRGQFAPSGVSSASLDRMSRQAKASHGKSKRKSLPSKWAEKKRKAEHIRQLVNQQFESMRTKG